MKLTRQSVIAATCLIVGGFIGASALVALAQTWTPAPGIPTTCPAGYPGCDAPINVGSSTQTKLGSLILNAALQNQNAFGLTVFGTSILNGTVQINSGSPVWGKVLMANDSSGTGVWVATSSLGITGGGGGVTSIIAGSGITVNQSTGNVTISTSSSVQTRVSGSCASGQAIQAINADGTVTCAPAPATTRQITCSGSATSPTCMLICQSTETIAYYSGCTYSHSFFNAYEITCNTGTVSTPGAGSGTATCSH